MGDRAQIRQIVEDWVLFRDAGDWQRFAGVWHDDAWMTATWFQGPASQFVEASRAGFEAGVRIHHFLGGHTSDVAGDRAIAQTKMEIHQRARVDGVLVDVTCSGRFYDFFERREGRWAIVRRQPVYEQDRLDVVQPGERLRIDEVELARYPVGYQYLAFVQERIGESAMTGLPGLTGPEIELLYREGRDWLEGAPTPGLPLTAHRQA